MTHSTQIEAYDTLKYIAQKQELVLRAIKSYNGLTLFELVKILEWPVNRITGRLNELVKLELVEDSGRRRINPESKKSGIIWQFKHDDTLLAVGNENKL